MKFFISKNSGLSLIEVLVGTALMLTVFLGIFGLIQLSFKLTAQAKARITATALANQKIELVHNLSYDQIGTVSGIPTGSIPEDENVTLNGITYNVKTTVTYVDDPFDGISPEDTDPWDYKKIKVRVAWGGFLQGVVTFLSDVTPKGLESDSGGGIISILVFDANGHPLPQADIHIENNLVTPAIDANYQTDNDGRLFLPGAPACNDCYKITVTKAGYSSERTYAAGEIIRGIQLVLPEKPLLSILDNQQSNISFSIDWLSSQTIYTIRYAEEITWNDSFEDLSKISEAFQTITDTVTGDVKLGQSAEQYFQNGYLISTVINASGIHEWGRLTWSQDLPASTEIRYHLLYASSSQWLMIPDADLTVDGITNSAGFTSSPVDLSGLDPIKYASVKIKADFHSDDPMQTPTLFNWQISWFSSETAVPIPNIVFSMEGAKSLGTDINGNQIRKYKQSLMTNASGQIVVGDLEWDSYNITINGLATGYDIANSLLPQPVAVNPGSGQTTTLKLANHQTNTLLVSAKGPDGVALEGATIRLYKTGYDKLNFASDSGQAFFSPLVSDIYTLEIKMAGYENWTGQINISGQTQHSASLSTL